MVCWVEKHVPLVAAAAAVVVVVVVLLPLNGPIVSNAILRRPKVSVESTDNNLQGEEMM